MTGHIHIIDNLAGEALELNTEVFPESANAWDSLAEACVKNGDKAKAIALYRKSIELNPANANATGNVELKALIEKRARDYFLFDRDCPLSWEPGGYDFLSPCLEEADIMRRSLAAISAGTYEGEHWLASFAIYAFYAE